MAIFAQAQQIIDSIPKASNVASSEITADLTIRCAARGWPGLFEIVFSDCGVAKLLEVGGSTCLVLGRYDDPALVAKSLDYYFASGALDSITAQARTARLSA
jgi:hypothetical protein